MLKAEEKQFIARLNRQSMTTHAVDLVPFPFTSCDGTLRGPRHNTQNFGVPGRGKRFLETNDSTQWSLALLPMVDGDLVIIHGHGGSSLDYIGTTRGRQISGARNLGTHTTMSSTALVRTLRLFVTKQFHYIIHACTCEKFAENFSAEMAKQTPRPLSVIGTNRDLSPSDPIQENPFEVVYYYGD